MAGSKYLLVFLVLVVIGAAFAFAAYIPEYYYAASCWCMAVICLGLGTLWFVCVPMIDRKSVV